MRITLLSLLLFISGYGLSQEEAFNVPVYNLEGETMNFQDVVSDGRYKVVVFWAGYCAGCKLEMKAINFFDEKWNTEYNADVLAVSIDAVQNKQRAVTVLEEKGFTGFELYFDHGLSLYKSLKGDMIPLTLLIDGQGNILNRWNFYDDGLESSIDLYLKKYNAQAAKEDS